MNEKITEYNKNNFYYEMYSIVRLIPEGKVATYGQIAALCGHPKAARVVGSALHRNPEPVVIPCHRVVNRFGGLAPAFAFGGKQVQRQWLEAEGVTVRDDDTVDLSVYGWKSNEL